MRDKATWLADLEADDDPEIVVSEDRLLAQEYDRRRERLAGELPELMRKADRCVKALGSSCCWSLLIVVRVCQRGSDGHGSPPAGDGRPDDGICDPSTGAQVRYRAELLG